MAKETRQEPVACPFYCNDDGVHRITCEGILDGSYISQYYRRKEDFALQMRVFCCEHYPKCEIHSILTDKYADTF